MESTITRRGFLKGILAAGMAPAFIGPDVLMPVRKVFTPGHDGASVLTLRDIRNIQDQMNRDLLIYRQFYMMISTPMLDNAMDNFGIDLTTAKCVEPHKVIIAQDRLPVVRSDILCNAMKTGGR